TCMKLSREGHLCTDYAIKTNVVWKPSKNFKHLNLKLLRMSGFEDEDKVTNYIRLVMKRTVWLKRIELHGENPCNKCDAIDPTSRRPHVDEARRRRIKEKLTHKSSSSVEIIIC
uniref:FBD domain-containing protein n=1 Tax=Aegilops tauschii subsp. strangulata TaxID=200361 RepID=A0A453RCZ4_AEGTS